MRSSVSHSQAGPHGSGGHEGGRALANRVLIAAQLVSLEALRYSPAGVPIVSASARHQSIQLEAGHPRQVTCQLALLVVGESARRFAALAPGVTLELAGFLSARHRNSPALVLRVSEFQTIQTD